MRNFASTLVKFSKLSHIQTTIWRPPKMAPPPHCGVSGALCYATADKEISDIEISSYEVETLLKEINIYKSEGPDKIHPKLLKSLCDNTNFVDAVTKLFRKCYETGCLPDVWKTAKITALYKKGAKCEAKNYRPISLTCILCKVFEKIIRNHILKCILSLLFTHHNMVF